MARSTTPRSGTRRSGTTVTKKAPAKRAPKAETPVSADAPVTGATSPTARKPRAKAAAKPAAPTVAAPKAVDAVTPPAVAKPKAPAKAKAPATANTRVKPKAPAKTKAAVKPAAAPKAKSTRGPTAASKPAPATTRGAKAKAGALAAVTSAAGKLPAVKIPDIKLPELPEVTPKRAAIGAGLLAGIGAAIFLWRSSQADQPDYRVVEQDGDFEVREYPATTTAAATTRGPRLEASDRNFNVLAAYIYAKSRPGEKLSMTIPVTHSGSAKDGWTTRFLMPPGRARGDLPAAPQGVTLESHPPRRVAAVRFSGRWSDDALFSTKEGALRSWLQLKGYPNEAKAEQAAYNSPMMLPPLRRNEVLVTLSEG